MEAVTENIVGWFLVVWAMMAVVRRQQMMELVSDYREHPASLLNGGIVTLLMGLYVIQTHASWSDVSAVLVSVFGWLCAVKGFMLLCFPEVWMSMIPSEKSLARITTMEAPLLLLAGGFILLNQ